MTKIRAIIPDNLGKGIKYTPSSKKWEVDLSEHVDNKTVHVVNGKLATIKEGCVQATNLNTLTAKTGTLAVLGHTCFYGYTGPNSNYLSIGAPLHLGDTTKRSTKAVASIDEYKQTFGTREGYDFNGWQIATDTEVLQYVYTQSGGTNLSGWSRSNDGGMNANGTLKNPNNWSDWVYELNLPAQPAQASGLDCAAIAALPKAAWKPNTSILVNQDGECKRLVPNENIFTDVVVDLAASKQNVEIPKNKSETVNIIATVTNAGTNPTGEVFVTLTKPQLGTYRLGTPTTNNIGETKTGELSWRVPVMASGKSLVITLPVTFSKVGSFSFGLQATSTIDTDKQNNIKTMTFTVTERIVNDGTNTNYVPTGKDCPLIIATDLTHNQRLNVYTTGTDEDFSQFGKYINVFADGRGFAGKQIKLEGASTVVVTSMGYRNANAEYSNYGGDSNGNYEEEAVEEGHSSLSSSSTTTSYSSGSSYSPAQGLVVAASGFYHGAAWNKDNIEPPVGLRNMGVFNAQTKIFTFRSDLTLPTRNTSFNAAPYHCVIWCRPAGKDCKWQGIPIVLGIKDTLPEIVSNIYEFTKIKGNITDDAGNKLPDFNEAIPDIINAANFVGGAKPSDLVTVSGNSLDEYGKFVTGNRHIVTVMSGQEAQFTIRSNSYLKNNLPKYISTGKTHTSYDASTKTLTVTVAADATLTDSVYWEDLKIIVK